MGLGDDMMWSGIIRDLYHDINKHESFEKRLKRISKYRMKNGMNMGIISCNKGNEKDDFKFFIKLKKKFSPNIVNYISPVFAINNPYLTTDLKYPNIITLVICTDEYFKSRGDNIILYDNMHAIERYCSILGLKNYSIKGDMHFTNDEKNKVEKYLPKEKFILVQPESHKKGKGYPFNKIQNIVNYFKDQIKFVQISPETFAGNKSKFLDNVIALKGIFSYRETLYFGNHAELCLFPEGGLAHGMSYSKVKTIVTYSGVFDAIMTKYPNQIAIEVCDKSHRCYRLNLGCEICDKFFLEHDENIIINEIKKNLNNKII